MTKYLIFSLLFIFFSCGNRNMKTFYPEPKESKFNFAITNGELIAWVYKNRMINEKLNDYPENKVSVITFINQAKVIKPHFLKGLVKNDTILELSAFNESYKNTIGYKGITCLLGDTIVIFDVNNIGGKYYDQYLVKKVPIDSVKLSEGKYFGVYYLFPENGTLKLWDK
jgi:hypothetical protein